MNLLCYSTTKTKSWTILLTKINNIFIFIVSGEPSFQNIFSPRMDYDQWKPLGRGDPLKHDPTFDYVPPVLDRVQYWVDPAMRKPDPPIPGETQKTEILLLGVTSKKPANTPIQADSRRDTFDSFIKYVDGPKFSQNVNRRVANPAFFPNPSSFFPSFFPPNKIKYMDNIPFSKGTDQKVPSTILMPPPLTANINTPIIQPVTESTIFTSPSISTSGSSTPSVTLQASNLVYHSSSGLNTDTTIPDKASTFTPVSFEPSITTSRSIPDFRDELVYNTHLTPPESFIRIQFAPNNFTSKPLLGSDSNQHISYVTPPALVKTNDNPIMFKGKVTDDDISNTYVKIGKTEAEMQSTFVGPNLNTVVKHPIPNMVMFPHSGKLKDNFEPKLPPLTMQTIQEMQEMRPPPATQTPMFQKTTNNIFKLLDKEKTKSSGSKDNSILSNTPEYIQSSSYFSSSFVATTNSTATSSTTSTTTSKPTEQPTTFTNIFTTTAPTTSSSTTSTTTTTTPPTTNSPLSHFIPQMRPMKSPLYLIIQGHSKVKTYGPSKQMHGILIQDTNEITDNDDKYNSRKNSEAKSLQDYTMDLIDEMKFRQGKSRNLGNIQTLKHVVQTGLGAIDLTGLDDDTERSDKNYQETELRVGYEVVKNKDMTEKYHKGIVEEARKLKD